MDDEADMSNAQQQDQCTSTEGMLELDNLKNLNKNGVNAQQQQHDTNNAITSSPGMDSDSEDDDDDYGISSSYHTHAHSHHKQKQHCTYFLGRTFNPHTDRPAMQTFQKSLYWLTYRNDLPVPLQPYSTATISAQALGNLYLARGGGLSGVATNGGYKGGMTSDAGWGCMLRSAQMMMAQAVRRHYAPPAAANGNIGEFPRRTIRHYSKRNNACRRSRSGSRLNPTNSSNIEHHIQNWRQLEDPWEVERIAKWFADFPNHVVTDDDDDFENDYFENDCDIINDIEKKMNNAAVSSSYAEHNTDKHHNTDNKENDADTTDCHYGKGGLNYHWYSLHQMVAAGLGLGTLPGEWYGPTTACHVLRELNEIHCERREGLARRMNDARGDGGSGMLDGRKKKKKNEEEEEAVREKKKGLTCDMFRVHVATEGCIYLDAISKLMTRSNGDIDTLSLDDDAENNDAANIVDQHNDPLSLPNDQIDDPLRPPPIISSRQTNNKSENKTKSCHWDTSLLLLLPLRLGIQSISTCNYGSTLAKLLSFPHSVGMLGGTPRHALWFYGADAVDPPLPACDDGDQDGSVGGWYGLDPHTVQLAPRGSRILVENRSTRGNNNTNNEERTTIPTHTHQWQVQLTDTYLRSLHFSPTTSHPNHSRSIPLSKLDPSCALGFYIQNPVDFLQFQSLLKGLSEGHCRPYKLPDIVTVLENTPNYEVDVSLVMKDMIGKKKREGVDGEGVDGVGGIIDDLDGFSMQSDEEEDNANAGHDEEDDDDDFVLI